MLWCDKYRPSELSKVEELFCFGIDQTLIVQTSRNFSFCCVAVAVVVVAVTRCYCEIVES